MVSTQAPRRQMRLCSGSEPITLKAFSRLPRETDRSSTQQTCSIFPSRNH